MLLYSFFIEHKAPRNEGKKSRRKAKGTADSDGGNDFKSQFFVGYL